MKQARDYRKYNVRLTSADWQRGSCYNVYCYKCVNVVYFCCSLYAMNTTIELVYVMIYAYNITNTAFVKS